jgi:hypothetical protein
MAAVAASTVKIFIIIESPLEVGLSREKNGQAQPPCGRNEFLAAAELSMASKCSLQVGEGVQQKVHSVAFAQHVHIVIRQQCVWISVEATRERPGGSKVGKSSSKAQLRHDQFN